MHYEGWKRTGFVFFIGLPQHQRLHSSLPFGDFGIELALEHFRSRTFFFLRRLIQSRMATPEDQVCGVLRAQVLFDSLEALFEEKTTDDFEQMEAYCAMWLAEKSTLSELERVIIDFYEVLNSNPSLDERVKRFRAHDVTLRASPSSRQRDLRLAVILDPLCLLPGPDEAGFFALLDESLALKEAQLDRQGISIRKRWPDAERDPNAAREWYDGQESLAREMGDRAVLAMVTNNLASLDIGVAESCADEAEAAHDWRMGFDGSRWCLRVAIELEREGDIVFAASHTLQAAAGFGDFEAFAHADLSIARKYVWDVLGLPPHSIAGFITATQDAQERLNAVAEDHQTEAWKTAVNALSLATTELQALYDRRSQS